MSKIVKKKKKKNSTLTFNFLSSACDSHGAAVSFDSECELSSTTWVSTGSEVGVEMNLRSGMEKDDVEGLLFEVLIAFFYIQIEFRFYIRVAAVHIKTFLE